MCGATPDSPLIQLVNREHYLRRPLSVKLRKQNIVSVVSVRTDTKENGERKKERKSERKKRKERKKEREKERKRERERKKTNEAMCHGRPAKMK